MASNSHHSLPAASNATLSLPTSSNTNLQLRNISTSTTMSSYLDVFLPSQLTSPSHVIPKCICNALFLVLLISAGEDLLEKDNSSSPPSLWVFLFIPLFASNFMEAAHCTYQLRQLLYFNTENTENKTDVEDVECIESGITTGNRTRSRSSSSGSSGGSIHGRRSRSSSFVEMTAAGELQEIGSREQLSAAAGNTANNHSTSTSMLVIGLIDQFGFAYAKCVLLYYLITNTTGTITESLLPYFLCVLTSIALRGLQIKQLQLQRSAEHIPFLTPPQLWSDILVTSVFFALRGMQIFLIALHIDRFIQVSWMLIFMPSWICVFGAFASALLLLSYTPMMYSNLTYASALKLNCHRLSFGLAIYLAVYAMTGFSTLLFLSERLAFEYDQPGFSSSNSNGVNHSITKILIPLIILMVFIAVTNPLLYNLTIKYKKALLSRRRQQIRILTARSSQGEYEENKHVCFMKTKSVVWLLQMSPTMYIVTDQKSLSSNVTIEPHNDAEGVSSSRSAPFSPSGWNTWLEGHSKSTPTIAASDNNDIEMTAISPLQHDTAPSSDNAYKSIMTDIPYSTLDASSTPNSPAQYCIVCLSRPVDSVIQDCGHSTCCLSCLISITVKSSSHHRPPTHQSTLANGSALQPPLGHCPMCRTGITTILQLKDAPFQVKDQKMAAISHVQYQVKHRQDVEEMELEPETDQDQEAVDRSYLHSTPSLLDVII